MFEKGVDIIEWMLKQMLKLFAQGCRSLKCSKGPKCETISVLNVITVLSVMKFGSNYFGDFSLSSDVSTFLRIGYIHTKVFIVQRLFKLAIPKRKYNSL